MDARHSRRARAALAAMPGIDPAISALALWCTHRDGDGPTRTRGDEITYGPSFEALPLSEQTGLLAHHVIHVALRHSARAAEMAERLGPAFNSRLYALASDAIVNEVLLQGGHALPRPAVRLSELLAQAIGPEAPDTILQSWDTDRLYLHLTGAASGAPVDGAQNALAYAQARNFAEDLEREGDAEATPEVWSVRVEQACDAGRAAGLGIGPHLHSFADLPQAQIPWEVHLRRLMARAVSEIPRISHKRPAHRWIAMEAQARQSGGATPVFQPGRARDARRPTLVIGLDTSSSITEAQLSLFAAEAASLARRSGAETHVLGFDTDVHTRLRLTCADAIKRIRFQRDGGTDFRDVLQEAAGLDPSVVVMLTDLDAPTGSAPGVPVIWAVPTKPPHPAPFGTVVIMDR